jgi:hypothetical protein
MVEIATAIILATANVPTAMVDQILILPPSTTSMVVLEINANG